MLFTLSDISLSLHRFPTQLELFAQSLATGASLEQVSVQLLDEKGQQLASGSSYSNGHLRLPANAKSKLLLATQKRQTSIIDLNRPVPDLAGFPIDGPQGYDKQLFLFGPRDLYRPGETVIVNVLLRDADGKPLPPQPMKAEVVQPNGEVAQTSVWQPEQAIWPAVLPGIRPLFNRESVYDYRTDRYHDEPIVAENSLAEFDVVYANAQGEKLVGQSSASLVLSEPGEYQLVVMDEVGQLTSVYLVRG